MIYTVQVTVEVCADTERLAAYYIRHALDNARKQEITYLDSEVLETREEEE